MTVIVPKAKKEKNLGLWAKSSTPIPGPIADCSLSSLCPLCASLSSRLSPDLMLSANKPPFSIRGFCRDKDRLCAHCLNGEHGNVLFSQLTSKCSQDLCEKIIIDCWIQFRRKTNPLKKKRGHQEWRVREGHPRQNTPNWPLGNASYTHIWSE